MSTQQRTYRGSRADAAPPPDDDIGADPGRCMAHGCPCRGSVDIGNTGRFLCAAHAWVTADRWQSITHELRQHQWMVDHMRQLREPAMQTRWRALADAFWRSNQPDMVPAADENRELYLYRLHLDLLYRVGARKTKPGPMLPQRLVPPVGEAGSTKPTVVAAAEYVPQAAGVLAQRVAGVPA